MLAELAANTPVMVCDIDVWKIPELGMNNMLLLHLPDGVPPSFECSISARRWENSICAVDPAALEPTSSNILYARRASSNFLRSGHSIEYA